MDYGKYEEGYGINLSRDQVKWRENAKELIVDLFISKADTFKEEYDDYCNENGLDPEDAETKEAFVDDYNDDSAYGSDGLEGLLINILNEYAAEKGYNAEFRYGDYCIYLPAYIPEDKEDQKKRMTIQDIQTVLKAYMSVLTENPITTEWLEICIR